jgi:hypothetical protein
MIRLMVYLNLQYSDARLLHHKYSVRAVQNV